MRSIPFPLFLCALLIMQTGRAQEHSLSLSPFISYDRFQASGFDAGLDYGAALSVRVVDGLSVRAGAALGSRSTTFDVAGGTRNLNGRLSELSLSMEYRIIGTGGSPSLLLSLGGGRISTTVDATTVSLGALGTLTIPAHAASHGFAEGGLTGILPVSRGVGIFLRPALRSTGAGSNSPDVSIAGGLRVGLF